MEGKIMIIVVALLALLVWVAVTFLSGYIGRINRRGNDGFWLGGILGFLGLIILGVTLVLDGVQLMVDRCDALRSPGVNGSD
jgi:protein-S-isoprenylcysteine O-methyltransferase Ste14